MVYLLFENLERASVSLLMLSAKQGNHWYHFVLLYKVHSERFNSVDSNIVVSCDIFIYHVVQLFLKPRKHPDFWQFSVL